MQRKNTTHQDNFDLEKEQNYRQEMLKKQESCIFDESIVVNEDEEDQKIIYAEVPKDVKNVQSQYEMLLRKYKQKELELADAENEHNDDKFDLIDQIRDQRKEVQFFTKLILNTLTFEDMEKLRFKSRWVDTDNSFQTPGF